MQLGDHRERFLAIGGGADYLDSRQQAKQQGEPFADDPLVVRGEHSYRFRGAGLVRETRLPARDEGVPMYFRLGKRYPYLAIVVGAVLIGTGAAFHGVTLEVTGAVAFAAGVAHSIAARRNGRPMGGDRPQSR
jgi:hypothetical protein